MSAFLPFLKSLVPPILWNSLKSIATARRKQKDSREESSRLRDHISRNLAIATGSIALRDSMTFRVHPESVYSIEHFCYISEEMTDELDSFLRQTADRHRLLDIGALHGVFSLAFTNHHPEKFAIAVDASPIAFSKLLYNSFSNPRCQITPVECAISDKNGDLAMTYAWEHLVASSNSNTEKMLLVPMCTGDELCSDNKFAPDCIKIDVKVTR